MFARSLTDVIPRTRQTIRTIQTMLTIFFTGRKLIVLDILPQEACSASYVSSITFFPICKAKTWIFIVGSQRKHFGDMDKSICHNGLKLASKFEKHHVLRLPHPRYSPGIIPCDFYPETTTKDRFVHWQAPASMCVNSESVSNEVGESESHSKKQNEHRIWTWRRIVTDVREEQSSNAAGLIRVN
jgi:hypothetical protein